MPVRRMIQVDGWWIQVPKNTFNVSVYLTPEKEGGYSVATPKLPGVASCGDTVVEAMDNMREALTVAVKTYLDLGEEIPWQPWVEEDVLGKKWKVVIVFTVKS